MMRNWFTCKIRYFKMGEDGKAKRVTEPYLIDALTYTEAEARIHKEVGAYVSNEFLITNIAKSPIAEVFHYDDSDVWYKAKVSYVDIDMDSGKEKKVSKNMLVTAHSVKQSCERLQESMKSMLVDFEIESVAKTTIVEIFPYVPGEEIPEGFKPLSEVEGGNAFGQVAQMVEQAAAMGAALESVVEEAAEDVEELADKVLEEAEEFVEEAVENVEDVIDEVVGEDEESDEDDEEKPKTGSEDDDDFEDEDLEAIESQLD